MKIIYWNTNNIENLDRITDILLDLQPDILFLSEINQLVLEKNQQQIADIDYEHYANPGCNRVSIIKKKGLQLELRLQNNYYTVVREVIDDINIVSLHLPSQMFQHLKALKEFIRDFRLTIDEEIGSSLDKRVLIIGDFNVNPHEEPMIDFDGFLASNSTHCRPSITHLKKKRTTYYNPTWKLYSRSNFPGTKQFHRPSGSSYDILEHHFLDQVVISQNLLSQISSESIDVVEKTTNYLFFDSSSLSIKGSDHLPLLYHFTITKL